ncbi:MAG: YncE family protein [Candidatus Promineifilaceae bacterium]
MKLDLTHRGSLAHRILALTVLIGVLLLALFLINQPFPTAVAGTGPAYLPVQFVPPPTPTPGPLPQLVEHVALPTAMCPNSTGFNQVSGLMYIANNYSNNVSVFENRAFVTDIPTGEWPTLIASDPYSKRTWVTNLHSGTSLLEGGAQVGFVPKDYEPYGAAYNPVNGYVYVTDLGSKVQVINGSELIATIELTDPDTGRGAGWMRPVVVDPRTGLVYAASWEYGRLYVIKDTEFVTSVRLGWGPLNMAIDTQRGLIYVAHYDPNPMYPHDISVVDLSTLQVTFVNSTPGEVNRARDVVVDERAGRAYVTNPNNTSVTVLSGTDILGKLRVGEQPWGIGINPNDGTIVVANRGDNSVSLIRDGEVQQTLPLPGIEPLAVGVDTLRNDIYVINRGRQTGTFTCRDASVSILH